MDKGKRLYRNHQCEGVRPCLRDQCQKCRDSARGPRCEGKPLGNHSARGRDSVVDRGSAWTRDGGWGRTPLREQM